MELEPIFPKPLVQGILDQTQQLGVLETVNILRAKVSGEGFHELTKPRNTDKARS